MAPKRSSKASTSRSQSNDVEDLAITNLRKAEGRKIVTGRDIVFPEEAPFQAIKNNITNLGYGIFLRLHELGEAQTAHVRQFYSLMTVKPDSEEIKLRMYQKNHTISFQNFSRIMEVPIHGNPFFSLSTKSYGEILDHLGITPLEFLTPLLLSVDPLPTSITFKDVNLKMEVRFLNKIIISNILPKKGDTDRLDANQLLILYCLTTGRQFNIFHMMLNHMEKVLQSQRGLPYGRHLNLLFGFLKFRQVETEKSMGALDSTSLTRMTRGKRARHDENEEEEDEFADMPGGSHQNEDEFEEMPAPTERRENHLVELRREVAELRGMVSSHDAKFLDIQSLQAELLSTQKELLRRFDTHFPPPQ